MSILDPFSLKGHPALVTGGSSGIGTAPAGRPAQTGADAAVADLDLAKADATAAELARLGVRTKAIAVDVTNAGQVQEMVAAVLSRWGRLNVAVNSAGIAIRSRAEALEEAERDAVVGAAIYLASDASQYVIGHDLVGDGGYTLW